MFKPKPLPPARLHFFFARQAPLGVVFRWGAGKQVRLILWNTNTDTFEPGHWFKGKIGVDTANLSPDGTLLIYEAHRWKRGQEDGYSDAWIAISKPPYLTALTLWPVDWGRVSGDFLDNQTVALRGGGAIYAEAHRKHPLPDKLMVQKSTDDRYPLQSRGWTFIASSPSFLFEKPLARTGFFLRQSASASSGLGQPIAYTLYDSGKDESWPLDAQQAEVDPSGRLIITRDCKLFVVAVDPSLPFTENALQETELADFNDMQFHAIAPPEWATHW